MRAVIDELGYESSLVAQSLRSRRTNVIGILVSDIEPFSAELLEGRRAGDPRHRLRPRRLLRTAASARTRSAGSGATSSRVSARSPTARSSSPRAASTSVRTRPVVAVDHNVGASDAADRRLGQPERRASRRPSTCSISAIGASASSRGRPDLESARLRERGYRQALEAAGIAFDPELVASAATSPRPRARRRASCCARPPADGDLRGERRLGDRDDRASRARSGCACPTTSRSSASTTSRSRRSASRR